MPIHLRDLARRFVRAHARIDAPHFREHCCDGGIALVAIVGPQLDHHARSHDSIVDALDPFGPCGLNYRAQCQHDQSKHVSHAPILARRLHWLNDRVFSRKKSFGA
jgi:hypothetical protein